MVRTIHIVLDCYILIDIILAPNDFDNLSKRKENSHYDVPFLLKLRLE